MSERLDTCQALAAMIREAGEPNEEEVTFVGMAAMQLGLTEEETAAVQETLKSGGDFDKALGGITSTPMRAFFFRRMLAATLLDEHINEQEQAYIDKTAKAFEVDGQLVADIIAWMKVGIDVETRLNVLLGKL